MLRTTRITRRLFSLGPEGETSGPEREFTVTLLDDSQERTNAINFFENQATRFFRSLDLPAVIDSMSHVDAQAYLDANPQLNAYNIIHVRLPRVTNCDLERLQYVPELTRIYLFGDFDNDGIAQLQHSTSVFDLKIYSNKITDDCLVNLSTLTSLQRIDLSRSRNISQAAFSKLVSELPSVPSCELQEDKIAG